MEDLPVVCGRVHKGVHLRPLRFSSTREAKILGVVAYCILFGPLMFTLVLCAVTGELGVWMIPLLVLPSLYLLDLIDDWRDLTAIKREHNAKIQRRAALSDQTPQKVSTSHHTTASPQKISTPRHVTTSPTTRRSKSHSTVTCYRCGKPMAVRTNRNTKQKFLGCTGYPRCRNTMGFRHAHA